MQNVNSQWVDAEKRVGDILVNEHVPATTRGDVSSCITSCPTRSLFRREKNLFARSYVCVCTYTYVCTCETCFRSRFVSPPFLFARRVGVKGFARLSCMHVQVLCMHGKYLYWPVAFVTGEQIVCPRLAYVACIDGRYGTNERYDARTNVSSFLRSLRLIHIRTSV